MDFDIITVNESCYQFVQGLNHSLIYYSHIPTALTALLVGVFVFLKSGKTLSSRLLLILTVLFSMWSAFDLILWTDFDTRLLMFFWSPIGLLTMLIFAVSVYFTYVFFDDADISFAKKLCIFGPIIPAILITPSTLNLNVFNSVSCEAVENQWFVNYYNFYGAVALVWIVVLALIRYRGADYHRRRQIILFTLGMEFFLFSFVTTGYLASLLGNFNLVIYGLFGMPIFMAFLAYLIVRYKAFDIKLFGAQALVVSLVILTGAQFFYIKTQTNFILTILSFIMVVSAGILLIKSFKRSEERKEELQIMADRLAVSNERLRELDHTKTEFISIASHQLRTPLTSIKGYCSLILEGAYGDVNPDLEEVIHRLIFSNDRLVNLVENLLNISRMEAGRMEYQFEEQPIEDILKELYASFTFAATSKKLDFKLSLPETPLPHLKLDKQKIQEVFSNLIDNAIKYTNEGDVVIEATYDQEKNKVHITVKDSGIGIPKEEVQFLFTKFSRGKDINRLHANGTGLGLYVAKNIIEAHKGKIWIESEGEGKGTTFVVELG